MLILSTYGKKVIKTVTTGNNMSFSFLQYNQVIRIELK